MKMLLFNLRCIIAYRLLLWGVSMTPDDYLKLKLISFINMVYKKRERKYNNDII